MKSIVNQAGTPADAMRRRIGEAEVLAANLRHAGPKALSLLELLDQIDADLAALADAGMDTRAELGRVEAVHATLRGKKGMLLRELRPAGGLARLREQRRPAPAHWWWFLDGAQADERRRTVLRYGRWALLAAVVLSAAFLAYQRFLRPDPRMVAIYTNQGTAQRDIAAGELQQAIPPLEQNMALDPTTAEWPIRLGVVEELLGDQSASAALFEKGRELAGSELDFLLPRGQYYLEASAYARARDDLLQATQLAPQSAPAFFYLARAYEGLDDNQAALEALDTAAELANQQPGEETIYVMARREMARLLQSGGMP